MNTPFFDNDSNLNSSNENNKRFSNVFNKNDNENKKVVAVTADNENNN